MPLNPRVLRKLFAAGSAIVVLVVAGFYLRGILNVRRDPHTAPTEIPGNIAQRAKEFNFSRSDGPRKLFSIHAASFEQFKEGGRAALHDVSIIIYGRNQDRSDQIYGSEFIYDPETKDVAAKGEVRIDLEANSTGGTGPGRVSAEEMRNLIHVKTSGLTFNGNTGLAQTTERVEFRVPEASGSAVGATYDSHAGVLALKSAVRIVTTDKQKATITGQSATITKAPNKIVLQTAKVEEPERTITADKVTVFLRDDNTVERILGSGNLHASRTGAKAFELNAAEGELKIGSDNQVNSGALTGGISYVSKSDSPARGKAGRALLLFGPKNRMTRARMEDSVEFEQGPVAKSQQLHDSAVDLYLVDGKRLEKAVTSAGPAEIRMMQGTEKTTISAGQFETKFNADNRLNALLGSPDAKIVTSTPGRPDRTTTSRELTAAFNSKGEIISAEQTGDFHYQEGTQIATSDRAKYVAVDDSIALTGSPRLVDSRGILTADTIHLNRKTGGAFAQGNVKSTYSGLKAQPGGAMLASAEPIHVTGTTVTANKSTEVAKYTNARLWQGANIVEAPEISFDRAHRSLQAQGGQPGQVKSVFVQPDKKGKVTPVNVTADKLSYVDSDRKAVFSGNVLVRAEATTITADTLEVFLLARGNRSDAQAGSQLDRIEGKGDIKIQQPNRRATGSQLVYTSAEQKIVLTGTENKRPSMFDAERGQISGDSLTFFTHDGRVLVGSGESSSDSHPKDSRRE